jgi:hypothetical protein
VKTVQVALDLLREAMWRKWFLGLFLAITAVLVLLGFSLQLDVVDGAIADEALEVPVRFLPEYDNVLLSHADRSRVLDRALLTGLYADGEVGNGSVLVDGLVQATWRSDPRRVPLVGEHDAGPDRRGQRLLHPG